jgi:hypothetical protein
VSWKKKSLKASKISSFFLRLYFIIVGDRQLIYLYHILFVVIINHGIVSKKRSGWLPST